MSLSAQINKLLILLNADNRRHLIGLLQKLSSGGLAATVFLSRG